MLFFSRWDNGETEKLSPWDVEPAGDDGESFYDMLHIFNRKTKKKKLFSGFLSVLIKCICVVVQTRSRRRKAAGSPSHRRR